MPPSPRAPLKQRIERALARVEARFGPDVVRRLRDAPARDRGDRGDRAVPTGSLGLDLATGIGGYPRGHLSEILGAESSGKTSLLYSALAATQRRGGFAAIVDAEGGLDGDALVACGVDLGDLLVAQPVSAPDALLILTILARCGGFDAIGLMAVSALRDLPGGGVRGSDQGELDGKDVARLAARWLRVLTAGLAESPTAVLVTNTTIARLGEYYTPGGLALRHHAALRVHVAPTAFILDAAGGAAGLRVRATIVKHKLGTAGGFADLDLGAGGIDATAELLEHGLRLGLIADTPLGLRYGPLQLGAGRRKARRLLETDKDIAAMLRAGIVHRWVAPAA